MINPPTWDSRPRLARRAVLRHDDVRNVDLVLLPERVVKLNATAAVVLRLCDGSRTVSNIVHELQVRYDSPDLEADVLEFLGGLAEQGVFA